MEVIHIRPPGSVGVLSGIASDTPWTIMDYDHSGKKTPFSRWLAINRKRHGAKFRHSRKDISVVGSGTQDLTEGKFSIIQEQDRGSSRYYFGFGEILPDDVPDLPTGKYKIWRRP